MDVSQLFIVRIWRSLAAGSGFRASVRAADAERAELFTQPGDLARYLDDASLAPRSEAPTPPEKPP